MIFGGERLYQLNIRPGYWQRKAEYLAQLESIQYLELYKPFDCPSSSI